MAIQKPKLITPKIVWKSWYFECHIYNSYLFINCVLQKVTLDKVLEC